MKKLLLALFLIANVGITNAAPKLLSSDWPVWNLTEGMHQENLLDNFDYRMKKYDRSLKWFKAGNAEIMFITLYDFISIQPTNTPTVILGVTDYSNGGDKIILKKSIKKPSDLKGKKIVLASNTISLWLLHNYLKKYGLTLNEVTIIHQSPTLSPLLFNENKTISGVVGWNPNIDEALNGNSYIAATSADFPRTIYDLIVAKKDFVVANSNEVEKFLSDYYISIHNDSIIDKTAARFSVSGDEYRLWLDDAIIFPSRKMADAEKENLRKSAHKIIDFLTVSPSSLQHPETISRFKKRDLDFEEMIQF